MSVATALAAFGLMLILEGLLPLTAPQLWRELFRRVISLADGQLRFVGLFSVILGSILLALATR
jgi:uncharacterized protein YjeT (DUF2065 family)